MIREDIKGEGAQQAGTSAERNLAKMGEKKCSLERSVEGPSRTQGANILKAHRTHLAVESEAESSRLLNLLTPMAS